MGYDIVDVSATQSHLMVYDCNYPKTERYITLTKNSSGQYTGWYYHMNDSYYWGSNYIGSWISYVPYSDFLASWNNRNGADNVNLLTINTDNATIKDVEGSVVANIRDGEVLTDRDDVYQIIELGVTTDGTTASSAGVSLWLPTDGLYTVTNTDRSVSNFEATLVNVEQSATVSTTALEIILGVSDDKKLTYAELPQASNDSYTITFSSTLGNSYQEVTLTGTAEQGAPALAQIEGKLYVEGVDLDSNASLKAGATEVSGSVQSDPMPDVAKIFVGSSAQSYTVAVNASPAKGGKVTGGGAYSENDPVTVTATANSGYRFVRWTKTANGQQVSTSTSYTFTANKDVNLTAVFEKTGGDDGDGAGPGTVSSSYQITAPITENGTVTITPESAKSGEKVTITSKPDDGYTIGSVTVTDSSGKSVSVMDNGNNTYIFTMPASQVTVTATFVAIETPWVNTFTDVSKSDWFYDGVAYAAQNGLMQGVGGDKFNPSGTTSRGMIATILYRLEGEPAASQSTFTDVAAGQYYTDAVAWAAANKIVEGYGNNTFGPNDDITREQMATILYRYADYKGYDVSELADLSGYTGQEKISSWALTAMRWANNKDIITGRTTTTLVPKGTATRAEATVLLARFCRQVISME